MKNAIRPGRRELLGLLATSTLPVLSLPLSSSQSTMPAMAKVAVYPLGEDDNPRSMSSSPSVAVRALLQGPLGTLGRQSPAACVRGILVEYYGPLVSETVLPANYKWVWVVDHWVWFCCNMTSFAIDFADRGILHVDVEEAFVLR